MKTDLKLCDRDADGDNPWNKQRPLIIYPRQGTEQFSRLVLLKCEET